MAKIRWNVVLPVQQLREREAAIYEHTTKMSKLTPSLEENSYNGLQIDS